MGLSKSQLSNILLSTVGVKTWPGATQSSIKTYMGLLRGKPILNSDGTWTTDEMVIDKTGSGYARILLGEYKYQAGLNSASPMNSSTNTSVTINESNEYTVQVYVDNHSEIHFNEVLKDWDTIGYFALYDAETGGEPKFVGKLTKQITPTKGSVAIIKTGDLRFYFEMTNFEDFTGDEVIPDDSMTVDDGGEVEVSLIPAGGLYANLPASRDGAGVITATIEGVSTSDYSIATADGKVTYPETISTTTTVVFSVPMQEGEPQTFTIIFKVTA